MTNERRTNCSCRRQSFGKMITCSNPQCKIEWFHYPCVQITRTPRGQWLCHTCRKQELVRQHFAFILYYLNDTLVHESCKQILSYAFEIRYHLKVFVFPLLRLLRNITYLSIYMILHLLTSNFSVQLLPATLAFKLTAHKLQP